MGRPLLNITGEKFHMLTVICHSYTNHDSYWLCECECGNMVVVAKGQLRAGHNKACGCLKGHASGRHNMSYTKVHRTWIGMRNRCMNPRNPGYKNYGGRGITVSKEWDSFEQFYADMGDPPENTAAWSIERMDNNAGYNKHNCRWATPKEQAQNRRS